VPIAHGTACSSAVVVRLCSVTCVDGEKKGVAGSESIGNRTSEGLLTDSCCAATPRKEERVRIYLISDYPATGDCPEERPQLRLRPSAVASRQISGHRAGRRSQAEQHIGSTSA
jgi:hypothetical protein